MSISIVVWAACATGLVLLSPRLVHIPHWSFFIILDQWSAPLICWVAPNNQLDKIFNYICTCTLNIDKVKNLNDSSFVKNICLSLMALRRNDSPRTDSKTIIKVKDGFWHSLVAFFLIFQILTARCLQNPILVLQRGQLQFIGFFCPRRLKQGSQKICPHGSTWKGSWRRSRHTGQITSSASSDSSGSPSSNSWCLYEKVQRLNYYWTTFNFASFLSFSFLTIFALSLSLYSFSLCLLFFLIFSFCFFDRKTISSSVEDSLLASAWSLSVLLSSLVPEMMSLSPLLVSAWSISYQ